MNFEKKVALSIIDKYKSTNIEFIPVEYDDCYILEPINWLYQDPLNEKKYNEETRAFEIFFRSNEGIRGGKLFYSIIDEIENTKYLDKISLLSLRRILIDKLLKDDKYKGVLFSINVSIPTLLDTSWFSHYISGFKNKLTRSDFKRVIFEIQEHPKNILEKNGIKENDLFSCFGFYKGNDINFAIDDEYDEGFIYKITGSILREDIVWKKMGWKFFQENVTHQEPLISEIRNELKNKNIAFIIEGVGNDFYKKFLLENIPLDSKEFPGIFIQSNNGIINIANKFDSNAELSTYPSEIKVKEISKEETTADINKTKLSKKRKKQIISVSAFLIVALFILLCYLLAPFKFVSIFKDINPDSFTYNHYNHQLKVLNRNGKVLWVKKIKGRRDARRLKLADLDNDKKNEVICGYPLEQDTLKFSSISCFDFKGEKKWTTYFKKKVKNLRTGEYFSPYYRITEPILCEDLNNDGNVEIIAIFNHVQYWPGFLTILDNKGNFLYQVLNRGYLMSLGTYNIDKDGIKDIFAGGTLNINSPDISSILMYINGKRVFDNDGRWINEICFAPVHDSIQTVDGYFCPQKTIFSLLKFGEGIETHEYIENICFTDEYLNILFYNEIAYKMGFKKLQLNLYYDFKKFNYYFEDSYLLEIDRIKNDPSVTEERIQKFCTNRYLYPQRLFFFNFDKMIIDSLLVRSNH